MRQGLPKTTTDLHMYIYDLSDWMTAIDDCQSWLPSMTVVVIDGGADDPTGRRQITRRCSTVDRHSACCS